MKVFTRTLYIKIITFQVASLFCISGISQAMDPLFVPNCSIEVDPISGDYYSSPTADPIVVPPPQPTSTPPAPSAPPKRKTSLWADLKGLGSSISELGASLDSGTGPKISGVQVITVNGTPYIGK